VFGTVRCGFVGECVCCVWDSLVWVWGVSVCCVWEGFVWVWVSECVLCVGQFGYGFVGSECVLCVGKFGVGLGE